MNRIVFALMMISISIKAQLPETDIFLPTITRSDSGYKFSKPLNITNRAGYDNQPYFTPDGKRLLYVSVEDSTQSDIYAYDLTAKVRVQITNTAVSEYSPAYSPDGKNLSVVRVDADSGQRFYYLPLSDMLKPVVIHNSDSIGYGCLLNDSMLAMFILGPSNTLQLLNMKNGKRELIASDIGRCMKLSKDGSQLYFVIKGNPVEWFIYSMNCNNHSLRRIVQTLPGCEDYALLADGTLIMGKEGKLYSNEKNSDWKIIADFTSALPDFYRIAVNPDGTLLALVAFTGKKP